MLDAAILAQLALAVGSLAQPAFAAAEKQHAGCVNLAGLTFDYQESFPAEDFSDKTCLDKCGMYNYAALFIEYGVTILPVPWIFRILPPYRPALTTAFLLRSTCYCGDEPGELNLLDGDVCSTPCGVEGGSTTCGHAGANGHYADLYAAPDNLPAAFERSVGTVADTTCESTTTTSTTTCTEGYEVPDLTPSGPLVTLSPYPPGPPAPAASTTSDVVAGGTEPSTIKSPPNDYEPSPSTTCASTLTTSVNVGVESGSTRDVTATVVISPGPAPTGGEEPPEGTGEEENPSIEPTDESTAPTDALDSPGDEATPTSPGEGEGEGQDPEATGEDPATATGSGSHVNTSLLALLLAIMAAVMMD